MPAAYGRRSVFSGVDARPQNTPPPGAVRAHSNEASRARIPVPNWNGIEYDGKTKCRGTTKLGAPCTAYAMPSTERCHGHTLRDE